MHRRTQDSILISTLALAVIVGKMVSAALSQPHNTQKPLMIIEPAAIAAVDHRAGSAGSGGSGGSGDQHAVAVQSRESWALHAQHQRSNTEVPPPNRDAGDAAMPASPR